MIMIIWLIAIEFPLYL